MSDEMKDLKMLVEQQQEIINELRAQVEELKYQLAVTHRQRPVVSLMEHLERLRQLHIEKYKDFLSAAGVDKYDNVRI
jgi:predicted RNase H-like nuclease (RuvC/YqgF family)